MGTLQADSTASGGYAVSLNGTMSMYTVYQFMPWNGPETQGECGSCRNHFRCASRSSPSAGSQFSQRPCRKGHTKRACAQARQPVVATPPPETNRTSRDTRNSCYARAAAGKPERLVFRPRIPRFAVFGPARANPDSPPRRTALQIGRPPERTQGGMPPKLGKLSCPDPIRQTVHLAPWASAC